MSNSSHPVPSPDTQPDSLAAFAEELRNLRVQAGSPTLGSLAAQTHVSKTVLSEALTGRRLPSDRTVAALAAAFGVDARDLLRRRNALGLHAPDAIVVADSAPAVGASRRPVLILVVGSFMLGASLAVAVTMAVTTGAGLRAAATAPTMTVTVVAPAIAVKTGEDPANTKCVDDAVVAASSTRTHDTQLQVIYSAACHAAWSRITRYDNQSTGNEVSTAIYRQIAPNASDRQSTTEPDAQSAYTTLLVRPTPETQVCAVGSITVSGKTISLGPPLCL